jgi:hypothetical protein
MSEWPRGGGAIEETQEILRIASNFYKDLFKWESRRHFKLDSGSWDEEDKVTAQENAELEAPFSESEIREAIFSSYSEGAPGPDGLPFYFIRNFGNALRGIFVIWLKNFR